jgi:hypothetical protein
LPTCVGLRYGRSPIWLEAFLGSLGADDFRMIAHARPLDHLCASGTSLGNKLSQRNLACPFARLTFPTASPLHSITIGSGAGISDLLAIAYDYNVLGLGPDSPWDD